MENKIKDLEYKLKCREDEMSELRAQIGNYQFQIAELAHKNKVQQEINKNYVDIVERLKLFIEECKDEKSHSIDEIEELLSL